MKRMAKVLVVLVLALALCQSAMAAPTQTAYRATASYGNHNGFMKNLSWLFGAIWGNNNHGAIWGTHGAIWSNGGH